jgi:hypothetical protein
MKLTPVVNFIDPFFDKNYAAILRFDSADATRDINYTKKSFMKLTPVVSVGKLFYFVND